MANSEDAKLKSIMDEVEASIKNLESELAPLLENDFEKYADKLPALERAKWYTLIAYAISSIIYGCQKLNGMDPNKLPVYTELQRIKQYFEKIKVAEDGQKSQAKPNLSLNKEAASRFIKHGLSGNEKFDEKRAKEQEQRKVNAHIRFDQLSVTETNDRAAPDDESTEAKKAATSTEDSAMKDASDGPPSEHPTFNADSKVKKHKKSSKKDRSHHKSSKPPRSTKAVFEDLLNRGSANAHTNPE